jgi:hypothetical protein
MIDYTITIGNIAEIASIIIGALFALSRMSATIGTKITLLHSDFSGVKSDVTDMKLEIKKVNEVAAKQITVEREETADQFSKLKEAFQQDQKVQDNNFAEVGFSLRRFIETVEKEMHKIEIWGRDNFALKSDVIDSTDRLREDIKTLGNDIRSDLRDLNGKIDGKQGVLLK